MNMTELRMEIERDEGVKLEIYLDHLGYKTCGIGHLCVEFKDPEFDMKVGDPVSVIRVGELFENDIQRTLRDCRVIHPDFDTLPDEVQKILANMCFQLGLTRFLKFKKTHDYIKQRDWKATANEMLDSLWAKQTPARAQRLSDRMRRVGGAT